MKTLGSVKINRQHDDQKKPDHSGKPKFTQYHGPEYRREIKILEP